MGASFHIKLDRGMVEIGTYYSVLRVGIVYLCTAVVLRSELQTTEYSL